MENWKEIAKKIKKVQRELHDLSLKLETVPKDIYKDEYHQVSERLEELKSNLEDRMFEEFPEKAEEDIFYEISERDETEQRRTENRSEASDMKPHFCKSCGKVIPPEEDYCKICEE